MVAVLTSNRSHGLNARNSSTVDRLERGVLGLTHDAVAPIVIITGR